MVTGEALHHGKAPRSSNRVIEESHDGGQLIADGRQPAKRSRVSRACDKCRGNREKCDGAQPKCQTCTSQNRPCSYNEQPKKRGIQPNYIRTLELILGWLCKTFPDAESRLASSLPFSDDPTHKLISGKDQEATEALHSAWRSCIVSRQIDQMLSGMPIEEDGPGDHDGLGNNQHLRVRRQSSPLSVPSHHSGLKHTSDDLTATNDAIQLLNMYERHARIDARGLNAAHHQLPNDAWILLEYYFTFTHSWLPMTEKHSILKIMYSYPPEGLHFGSITDSEHAELWSIMALAAAQVYVDTRKDEIQRMRNIAESLLPERDATHELPHIKAMILLTLTDIQGGHMLRGWLRIGTVVRLLYLFRLLENLGQTARWCRHIHLVAFVIESALSLHFRATNHLRASYLEVVGFVEEDGIDEWSPWIDPLDGSQQSGMAKAPARSFSTLNSLVRTYMRLTKEFSILQPNASINGVEASPLFALLENAASKHGRVQPCILVQRYHQAPRDESDRPRSRHGEEVPSRTSLDSSMLQADRTSELPDLQAGHPFMSIPNVSSNYAFPSTSSISNAGPSLSYLWAGDASMDPNFGVTNQTPETGDGSSNIFEELATLERQDSAHHPQFLRNLGYGPDLDLAEFFGSNYQPSESLLAYLQPSNPGTMDNGPVLDMNPV